MGISGKKEALETKKVISMLSLALISQESSILKFAGRSHFKKKKKNKIQALK